VRIIKFLFSKLFICFLVIAALLAAIIFLCVYIRSLLPAAAAVALFYSLSLFACAHILNGNMPHEFKCVWLSLIIALPPLGAALYLCTRTGKPRYIAKAYVPLPFDGCEYFADGAALLERLTSLIDGAKESVMLDYYIIAKGRVWQKIFSVLKAAIKRGVKVTVVYDGFGSALRAPKDDLNKLKRMGADIRVFNPPNPFHLSGINTRDHRKCAVIDGYAALIGGVNIADEYAHLTHPHAFWKDGGALLYGEIAEAFLSEIFNAEIPDIAKSLPNNHRLNRTANLIRPIFDGEGSGFFEDELTEKIYGAKRRVHIFTPYLCPGEKLLSALMHAAREGADAKIILPGVPDKKLTFAISKIYGEKLAAAGIGVYLYTPGFMHLKGMVCDKTAYIGSYNFDFRSLNSNLENGVFTAALTDDLEADFLHTLALCRPLKTNCQNVAVNFFYKALCLLAPLM